MPTCCNILSFSNGLVAVLDTAPAIPPVIRWPRLTFFLVIFLFSSSLDWLRSSDSSLSWTFDLLFEVYCVDSYGYPFIIYLVCSVNIWLSKKNWRMLRFQIPTFRLSCFNFPDSRCSSHHGEVSLSDLQPQINNYKGSSISPAIWPAPIIAIVFNPNIGVIRCTCASWYLTQLSNIRGNIII